VAKVRIPSALAIKEPEKYFEVKQFPKDVAPKRALGSLPEIKDQRLKLSLDEGKAVTQDDLINKESAALDYSLPPGMRAVAIKVTTESLVGGFVLPNTHVDVIHTTRGTDGSAKMILQNMLVLAVDTVDKRHAETTTIIGQTITLAATPEEAIRLSLASATGELRLLLKGANDNTRTANIEVRPDDLKRPAGQSAADREAEANESRPMAATLPPELPPEMKSEPKEEETRQPIRKRAKMHVLIIRNGLSVDKTVYRTDRDDDEEGAAGPSSTESDRKDEKKPEDRSKTNPAPSKPANPPVNPPSAFGKSTRTKRIQ